MRIAVIILTLVGVASFTFNLYLWWQKDLLTDNLINTKQVASSTVEKLSAELVFATSTITNLTFELTTLGEQYEKLKKDYDEERNRNEDFEDQIHKITKTVGVLDKLSKTDEELLQKYSKVYFLNENYIPSNIKSINSEYILEGRQPQSFHGEALPFLEDMLQAAADDNIDLKVISAYRSFDEQTVLKGAYTQTYGTGANTFSADQGYSEHQLGTTLDLSDQTTNGPYLAFENTDSYAWLLKNAYRFGFVLSYPENNGYYIFEPWHWRFVGEDLAKYLEKKDLSFYDLDQRTIDTYLVNIFD
ncbi:MAG: hypothetical protein AUK16_03075 [Parcubacteria group bacterium CG2_30_44_11]|nr:MAG: hypothetical protein AUK16_03075 [Parcubacteria group bacterium CG2_30_44_11]